MADIAKLVEELSKLTVMEAAELAKTLETEWGVSAAAAVAGDAYGVVARYIASLAGFGPRDHRGLERFACLLFAAVSLPAQFLPLALAHASKRGERAAVKQGAGMLPSGDAAPPIVAQVEGACE